MSVFVDTVGLLWAILQMTATVWAVILGPLDEGFNIIAPPFQTHTNTQALILKIDGNGHYKYRLSFVVRKLN